MSLERASLLAMAAGLLLIAQPWLHVLFVAGFPLALAGIIGFNVSGWLGRGGKGGS